MELTVTFQEKTANVAIVGSIDTLTSQELSDEISKTAPQCEKMILDMTEVDYISSAGLRAIIAASRLIGKDNLILRGVNKNVMEVFRMTGFNKALNIEE